MKNVTRKLKLKYHRHRNINGVIKTNQGYEKYKGCDMFFGKGKKVKALTNMEFHSISLIDHCQNCGNKDMTKPGIIHATGDTCYHPCAVTPIQ